MGLNAGDEVVFPVDGSRAVLARTADWRPGAPGPVSAFIDTNVLNRHLTGDPPRLAARAAAYLRAESELFLTDLVAAETVYVLESFYEAPRSQIAEAIRSMIAFRSIVVVDPPPAATSRRGVRDRSARLR